MTKQSEAAKIFFIGHDPDKELRDCEKKSVNKILL